MVSNGTLVVLKGVYSSEHLNNELACVVDEVCQSDIRAS